MKNTKQRYLHDPKFHGLVDAIANQIWMEVLTFKDMEDAVNLAKIIIDESTDCKPVSKPSVNQNNISKPTGSKD